MSASTIYRLLPIEHEMPVVLGQVPSEELKRQLIDHVRHELGPIATPFELEFATSLPKTRSGKILRRVLKARELRIEPGDLTTIAE